jgi:hypothetical protein
MTALIHLHYEHGPVEARHITNSRRRISYNKAEPKIWQTLNHLINLDGR